MELRGIEGIWRKFFLTLAASFVVLIAVFLLLVDPSTFWQELRAFPETTLALILLVIVGAWMTDALRVKILARALGTSIPWSLLVVTLMVSNFLTLATPFAAGGAPIVVYCLYRRGMSFGKATAVVVGGGLTSQFGLFTLLAVVMTFMASHLVEIMGSFRPVQFFLAAYGAGLFLFMVLTQQSRQLKVWIDRKIASSGGKTSWTLRALSWVANMVEEFADSYRLLFEHRWTYLVTAWLLAVTYFALQFTSGFLLLTGFGVAKETPFFRYGLSALLTAVPVFSPIPGGTGAAEYAAFLVLDGLARPELIGTFIVLWRFFTFYTPLLSGSAVFPFLLLYLRGKRRGE